MKVTNEQITHLATLSNFSLSAEEAAALKTDLENILKHISALDALDTENVDPTYQVFEMKNIWRPDEILPQEADRTALLSLAPAEKDHQIKVPKVL